MERHSPHFAAGTQDQVNNNSLPPSSTQISEESSSGCEAGDQKNYKNGRNNGWTDVLIDGGTEHHDSGHFTVSPDVDHNNVPSTEGSGCSGSSRGASPNHFHVDNISSSSSNDRRPASSAALVLQACRERKSADITSSLPKNYAYSESCKYKGNSTDSLGRSGGGDVESDESSSSPSVGYLKTAFDNFNALYQEKLKMIDEAGAQGDMDMKQSVVEKKAEILECWAKDVCVQNIVLIHTVEDLEKQGEEKMRTLQQKISESSSLAQRHKAVVESYEERIQILLKERASSHDAHMNLKQDLEKMKTEYKRIRGRVDQLEKDNDSLITLITRIRDMGVWDVEGLEFHRRTFDHIFGLYPHLPGSEVQTVFTREKARHIRETENAVEKLESKVSDLEAFQLKACQVIDTKDSTISELKAEMARIGQKLQGCQEECDHYKKSLIETHEKLLHTTNELQIRTKIPSRPNTASEADSERHLEIQELLQELRSVKDRLNISVQESQSAKEETNMIRKEFSDRLKAMQESQQCLQSELTHSFDTHHLVQEKQIELEKVREEVQTYQTKCETTEAELHNKDKIIEELQNTIKQLNDKKTESDGDSQSINMKDPLAASKTFTPLTNYLKCGRDRPCKTALPTRHIAQQRNGGKPAWNDHFIKTSALDNNCSSSTATIASTSKSSILLGYKKEAGGNCNRSSCDHSKVSNKMYSFMSNYDMHKSSPTSNNLNRTAEQKSPSRCKSKISLCSCANLDPGQKYTGLLDSPCRTNCSNSANYSFEINSSLKNERKADDNTGLKNVEEKNRNQEKFIKTDRKQTFDDGQNIKDDYAGLKPDRLAKHSATFDRLMGVAINASKNILDSDIPKNLSSVSITAGHLSHHRNKTGSRRQFTATASRINPANEPQDTRKDPPDLIKIDIVVDESDSPSSSTHKPHISKSLEDLLLELPESQPYTKAVREWMRSAGASRNEKSSTSNIRPKNPTLRKTVPKPDNTDKTLSRIASEKNLLRSSSKLYADKTLEIETDIVGIQEEWSRVFCEADLPHTDHDHSDHRYIIPEETPSTNQDNSEESTGEAVVVTAAMSGTHNTPQLMQQFEMEKVKLTEDFLKQLKDKNIEIRMQKDGLENDEAVSFWELLNVFENLKLEANKKIEDLRWVNTSLIYNLHGMNTKLLNFDQLVKKAKSCNDDSCLSCSSASAIATVSPGYEKRILGHFAREIQELLVESRNSTANIETLQSILQKMESFGPDTKDEVRKMEHELKLLEGINSKLLSNLVISDKEILRLNETADCLTLEKERAEEEMVLAQLEVQRLRELNSDLSLCPANMRINMERMKQAFLKNEEILLSKTEEIAKKDDLITQYDYYCKKAQQYLDAKTSVTEQQQAEREEWECEKSQMKSEKKELEKTVATLEDKLIRSETTNRSLHEMLDWYMKQVDRVENLHKSYIRTLPRAAVSDFEKLFRIVKDQDRPTTPGEGSGDADNNNLQ